MLTNTGQTDELTNQVGTYLCDKVFVFYLPRNPKKREKLVKFKHSFKTPAVKSSA